MFTEANLKALVPRKIFERGSAYYYEDNAVGRIRRTGDTFKAKVEGTETYRVELTIRAGKPPKIYCDCPYNYGDVCKHGIALGLGRTRLVREWRRTRPCRRSCPFNRKRPSGSVANRRLGPYHRPRTIGVSAAVLIAEA